MTFWNVPFFKLKARYNENKILRNEKTIDNRREIITELIYS
jgi:hypothetical protein